MVRNDEAQAAIVAYLKSKTAITSELPAGATEIREDTWQGTDFTYPNIRVRLIDNTPIAGRDCNLNRITFSCMVFSEEYSSQQADRITGIIIETLHDTAFSSNNFSFSLRGTSLVPAIRVDERTWRSEAFMTTTVSG